MINNKNVYYYIYLHNKFRKNGPLMKEVQDGLHHGKVVTLLTLV